AFAIDICDRISCQSIRADIDDRDDTVGKKIRNGEKEWIPYLLVVGEKEKTSGRLNVRSREDRSQREMAVDDFIGMVSKKTSGMPFRPLPLPRLVSKAPLFYG
ncbi:unnamed protein product, partial [marine sediment metagenome]